MATFYKIELRTFDTSTLSSSFQSFGSALSKAVRNAEFINTSTVDVYISVDGSTNAFCIPAGKTVPVNGIFYSLKLDDGMFVFKAGAQLSVKQVTGAAAGTLIGHFYE